MRDGSKIRAVESSQLINPSNRGGRRLVLHRESKPVIPSDPISASNIQSVEKCTYTVCSVVGSHH